MNDLESDILKIKAENPSWGRYRITEALLKGGHSTSLATVQRRLAALNLNNVADDNRDKIVDKFSKFSDSELRAILASAAQNDVPVEPIGWSDDSVKILVMSDTHIGHKKFKEERWWAMAELAEKEGVDLAFHAGDVLEGMSGRPGHVYELSEIGFEAQFGKACELIDGFPMEIRGITGNHDLWYQGKADIGLNVGVRLEESLSGKWVHLGDEEADIKIGNVKLKLFHGRDGSSYATSYRTQKLIESLSGGEKPHILFAGHAHKAIYHQCRNVQVFESGTLCGQTGFMRGKKLEAHMGFWIVEIWQNSGGIERIKPQWVPFFER